MPDTILDGSGEQTPGRRPLEGTDLEIAYTLLGDDLVLRVNKAGVQVFGVVLENARKELDCQAAARIEDGEIGSCGLYPSSRRYRCQRGLCARTCDEQADEGSAREDGQNLEDNRRK